MLKEKERKIVYGRYLRRLLDNQHLTPARRGLLSEAGARRYNQKLKNEGFVRFTKSKAGKKYAQFSPEGIKFLETFGINVGVDK